MVFKLGLEAQKHWRRLQGFERFQRSLPGSISSMVKNKANRPLNTTQLGSRPTAYTIRAPNGLKLGQIFGTHPEASTRAANLLTKC
jgi:hypothetical protein